MGSSQKRSESDPRDTNRGFHAVDGVSDLRVEFCPFAKDKVRMIRPLQKDNVEESAAFCALPERDPRSREARPLNPATRAPLSPGPGSATFHLILRGEGGLEALQSRSEGLTTSTPKYGAISALISAQLRLQFIGVC
jgi:hypothetical protein